MPPSDAPSGEAGEMSGPVLETAEVDMEIDQVSTELPTLPKAEVEGSEASLPST